MRLTERQRAVLERVKARNVAMHGPETGPEIGMALLGDGFTSCEQGQRTCKQLVAKGLLCELGFGEFNARCYGLAGRDDLHLKGKK